MTAPFIFIGTHRIKEGKVEDFKNDSREVVELVEAKEPRLIGFNLYLNEDGTETAVVQVHPDADSMLFHMQVAQEHIEGAYAETLDVTTGLQIYGRPNDPVLEMMRQLAGSGVPLTVKPEHIGGFTRLQAG